MVEDGVNGLIVEPGDVDGAHRRDRALLRRRRARRAPARGAPRRRSRGYAPEQVYGRLERILVRRRARMKPRVLFVGAGRATGCRSPRASRASGTRSRSGSTCAVLADARRPARDDRASELVPPPPSSTGRSSTRRCRRASRRELRELPARRRRRAEPVRGGAVVVARALARSPAKLVVEVHGDWRTATRLYGSRAAARCSARSPTRSRGWARPPRRRRADRLAVHDAGSSRELAVEPVGEFPTYIGPRRVPRAPPGPLPERAARALRRRARALQERRRCSRPPGAWSAERAAGGAAAPRRPRARRSRWPRARRATGVEWTTAARPDGAVAAALDEARLLVLPSRSEGLRRVVDGGVLRGRAVVGGARRRHPRHRRATARNGVLVEPGDAAALADALVRMLARPRAGRAARRGGARRAPRAGSRRPEEYADNVRAVVDHVLAGNGATS